MTQQPRIPDSETSKRLLENLRKTHLQTQEFNKELAEINARLAQYISQQRLQRVRRSLDNLPVETQKSLE